MGGDRPKQLLKLADGRYVLEHAVDAFEQAACIDEILIVMHPDWMQETEQLRRQNSWQKVSHVLPGGRERWESSIHAIEAYPDQEDVALLLHDAARPWVSQRIIADVCHALENHRAVTVAVPMTDTLYRVADGHVADIPPRANYMRAQTPQAFHIDLIREAYRRALAQPTIAATDDCGIVRRYMPDEKIYIVAGEEQNRKITYRDDL